MLLTPVLTILKTRQDSPNANREHSSLDCFAVVHCDADHYIDWEKITYGVSKGAEGEDWWSTVLFVVATVQYLFLTLCGPADGGAFISALIRLKEATAAVLAAAAAAAFAISMATVAAMTMAAARVRRSSYS